jgi:Delta7-sterol 5-desaturase
MDIVLEGFDTYLFDYAYAQLFPANPSYDALKSNASATFSSMREEPTALYNNYEFKRSTEYFQFPPGPNAYLTSWPRDDPIRQLVNLYLITA